MYLKQIFIVIISCSLGACASSNSDDVGGSGAGSSRGSDCIFESSIRGYEVLDESNLVIDASGRRKYHVSLRRRAYGLRSAWSIGFVSPTSRICASFSEVAFEGHMDNETIRIASIRELDADEYEYLLIQYGKKEPEIEQGPAPKEVEGAEVEELDPDAIDDPSGN